MHVYDLCVCTWRCAHCSLPYSLATESLTEPKTLVFFVICLLAHLLAFLGAEIPSESIASVIVSFPVAVRKHPEQKQLKGDRGHLA